VVNVVLSPKTLPTVTVWSKPLPIKFQPAIKFTEDMLEVAEPNVVVVAVPTVVVVLPLVEEVLAAVVSLPAAKVVKLAVLDAVTLPLGSVEVTLTW